MPDYKKVDPAPGYAAAVILGRNANGWTAWENVDVVTLDQIKRKNMDYVTIKVP